MSGQCVPSEGRSIRKRMHSEEKGTREDTPGYRQNPGTRGKDGNDDNGDGKSQRGRE